MFEDNFNYLSKMCLLRMREAAFRMIAMAGKRQCEVIVCGSDATDHSREYLEQGADFVLSGEGEGHLDRAFGPHAPGAATNRWRRSQVCASWQPTAAFADTGSRPLLIDLDALPAPARDLIDMERYASIWRQRHGMFSLNMATTRGCPSIATGAPSPSGGRPTTPVALSTWSPRWRR